MLFLLPCNVNAGRRAPVAGVPIKVLKDFSSSWLYQYDADDYDLMLHPYTVDDPVLGELGVLWDLNSDEIVNLQDFSILSKINMTQFIADVNKLRRPFTPEYMQTLITSILDKEKELGIDDISKNTRKREYVYARKLFIYLVKKAL